MRHGTPLILLATAKALTTIMALHAKHAPERQDLSAAQQKVNVIVNLLRVLYGVNKLKNVSVPMDNFITQF